MFKLPQTAMTMNTNAKEADKILTDTTACTEMIMDTMPSISDDVDMSSAPGLIDVDLNDYAKTIRGPTEPHEQKTVWTGLLEFTEKQRPGDDVTRTVRSIPTQLTACVDGPSINTSLWREKLSICFIPNAVMTPLQTLIKDKRTVTFHFTPDDSDAVTSLCHHLSGHVGFISVQQLPANRREVRFMVIKYSFRKRQFFGLIPRDETRFLTELRSIVTRNQMIQPQSQTPLTMNSQQQQQQQLPQTMPGFPTQTRCDVPPEKPMHPLPSKDAVPNISDSVTVSGPELIGVDLSNPAKTLQAAAVQQRQRIVYTGGLEFTERKKPGDTSPQITIWCTPIQLSASVDVDINTSKFREDVVMNFIPKVVMVPLLTLIKDSQAVTCLFSPNDPDSVACLQHHLSGYFGCLIMQYLKNKPREAKVMVMTYSSRKRQFFGYLPNDQMRFLSALRVIIRKHKTLDESVLANAFGALSIQPALFTSSAQQKEQLCQQPQQSFFATVPQASENVQPRLQSSCMPPQLQPLQNSEQVSGDMDSDVS